MSRFFFVTIFMISYRAQQKLYLKNLWKITLFSHEDLVMI